MATEVNTVLHWVTSTETIDEAYLGREEEEEEGMEVGKIECHGSNELWIVSLTEKINARSVSWFGRAACDIQSTTYNNNSSSVLQNQQKMYTLKALK